MRTPTHILFDTIVLFLLDIFHALDFTIIGLSIMICAELIDLDHLFSKPIYAPRRNPFKTHFLHKKWLYVLIFSILLFFNSYSIYLGIGLMCHLFLDLIYIKLYKIK